jgi:bifunctional UDP-N-acetylglucosamine pyrophosphorylase / glucosamine-1-phosphate N-acetyltransferase
MNRSLAVVILAAGKGKRMKSDLPKVMLPVGGVPSLHHPLEAARALDPERIATVVGYKAEVVREAFAGKGIEFVTQEEQLGTGHAVQVTEDVFADFNGVLLVLYGDGPLIRKETLARLLATHAEQGNDATLLTCRKPDPSDYGRIVRDGKGGFRAIVEERDCDEETRRIDEVYTGIAVYPAPGIFECLSRIGNNNAQGEYYLTDVPGILLADGGRVGTELHDDPDEIEGFNSRDQYDAICRTFESRHGTER